MTAKFITVLMLPECIHIMSHFSEICNPGFPKAPGKEFHLKHRLVIRAKLRQL